MREQASSLYSVTPYFFAKILADLPFAILDAVVFSLIVYWPVGLNDTSPEKFVIFCMMLRDNWIK